MTLLALSALVLSSACAAGAPRATGTAPPSTAQASTAIPPTPPTPPTPTTPKPSVATTVLRPTSIATAPVTLAPPQSPPGGLLDGGEGDRPVAGWPGSFCWHGLCGDVPQIAPKSQLPVVSFGAGDLELTLAGGTPFVRWFAAYGESGTSLQPLAEGGEPVDPDAVGASPPPQFTSATFAPPPDGDWVLTVQVFFTEGDAMYAWHATGS